MTQKELLYLEDAIGHEKSIITICSETKRMLQDEKLKVFIQGELDKHTALNTRLMNLLEAKANE